MQGQCIGSFPLVLFLYPFDCSQLAVLDNVSEAPFEPLMKCTKKQTTYSLFHPGSDFFLEWNLLKNCYEITVKKKKKVAFPKVFCQPRKLGISSKTGFWRLQNGPLEAKQVENSTWRPPRQGSVARNKRFSPENRTLEPKVVRKIRSRECISNKQEVRINEISLYY